MARDTTVTLPWPPYKLSQNGQHGSMWAHRSALDKYSAAATEALEGVTLPDPGEGDIRLTITFHPPTVTRPDLDNGLTRLKAGIDALAKHWGVNDNRFEYDLRHGAKVKGGAVSITIGGAA